MSERAKGWYHVKVEGEWTAALHQGDGGWRYFELFALDDWFEEIGARIPSPEDMGQWKLVPVEPTPEMLREYQRASVAPVGRISLQGWEAMISAAPRFGDDR